MLDLDKLPDHILSDIEENTNNPELCSVEEAFNLWLSYNGIIGYTSLIMEAIEAIKNAEVK
jgi:hypothetical protein